jgi:hypothetical protein
MKSLTVVYSPLCEGNGAFLGQLEEWLHGTDVTLCSIPFDTITDRERGWYRSAGLVRRNGRFKKSVFIDVFFEGELIDSVPVKRERIEKNLGICIREKEEDPAEESREMSVAEFRELLFHDEIEWVRINRDTYREEMRLCIENYPYGNPPKRFHQQCMNLKEKVFTEVFTMEDIAGVFARWGNTVVGLLEVFPREIIKKYGFLTGTCGSDEDYLTVGCFEVGYGIPRKEMIDELFFHLESCYPDFYRHLLEGVGTVEWNTGFTPYWVYDKYGFSRSETINERTVIMEKRI